MTVNPDLTLSFSPLHRLQWEEAQQKYVILYPEGLVELNQSSAAILQLCDGAHTPAKLVAELEQKFETTGLEKDISQFLEVALKNGWIKQP
jgi:pyrroloquinoline quinone biosynthesis protein D